MFRRGYTNKGLQLVFQIT